MPPPTTSIARRETLSCSLPSPSSWTSSPCRRPSGSFDHLVGAEQHDLGQCDLERGRRLQVDGEREPRRPFDRQLAGRGATKDTLHIVGGATAQFAGDCAVAEKAAL